MPASFSPLARKARFAAWVRPDRISLPMISTQAVTVFGGVSAWLIGPRMLLCREICPPFYAKPARHTIAGIAAHAPAGRHCRRGTLCLPHNRNPMAMIAPVFGSDYDLGARPGGCADGVKSVGPCSRI